MLNGKKIALGVTGGIAVYKAVDLVSRLRKQGAEVRVIMTEHAQQFVTPLTFKEISGNKVAVSMWDSNQEFNVEHIALANWADAFVVAPATANILAKMANGIADDLLSTTLLAAQAPIIVCPAMNTGMYQNSITQENIEKLQKHGVTVMPPAVGYLACGVTGPGRLPEPQQIVEFIDAFFAKKDGDMVGMKVLVTAAGTREPIDPVRFVGNRSSGKMGYAIAQAAAQRGAEVLLVTGPSALEIPPNVNGVKVESTNEMLEACMEAYEKMDVVIKAAAVADYRPRDVADQKIKKKTDDALTVVMDKNPDILKELGARKAHQILVGFAAETQNLLDNAREKIVKKNLDMIVANDVTAAGAGFNSDTNIVKFLFPNGEVRSLEQMAKTQVANILLDTVMELKAKK
ncbi:MAG: bifunctional phosphopantothenoylcysteine decarboxylase/phosphopantothenate--cysteine ligase CoaBC [Phascolarctobacterium sp.]|nr:bifunctional phosphopantothenoylcysteine decarboxylase/phosphopantothenate--cysteine ligase CoaBC [Phascolarctobacterium sp.]MBQ5348988.1 bifunctional phosphopantothenoylcysteine decarboxylase/phosphopantothenate--cysteine ligase CoaBC [Phascolarctobacterium sp.]MBQ5625106.1 bifunctional phosphopantothenoylcysteine decarboxylase/phosphopantothenate--cysteine ligase CoaBC [Phascolarctobacterium sp.]MBQ5673025.1 bifunctional phosphopantothenoylcysteine decarboxylase/phosphopantothenate--cystein